MYIFFALLLSAKFVNAKTTAHILSQTYDRLSFQDATGNYIDSHFLSTHSAYPVSYASTGDQPGQNLEFLLHDDNNYWVSQHPNSDDFHSTISFTFSEPTIFEAFLLSAAFKSGDKNQNIREYHGFPTKLKVYIAMTDDDDFTLNTIFSGTPSYPLEKAQFVFKNPVKCKRMKIEFIDITANTHFSEGAKTACIRFLNFIKQLDYYDLQYKIPNGNYDYPLYVNFYQIPDDEFSYSSSGDFDKYPIKNAFDNSDNYWIANDLSDGSSKSHIIINFKKPTLFEGFLIKGTNYQKYNALKVRYDQYYPGIPLQVNLYIANNTDEFSFHSKFSGSPSDRKVIYQYILERKILCERIKIEFVDVEKDDDVSKSKRARIYHLTLLQSFENEGIMSEGVNGNYADPGYISTRTVPSSDFTLTATGGSQSGHSISTDTIDNDDTTYWVSNVPNSEAFHNSVIVDFNKAVELEAVLIDPVYRTKDGIHVFSGFPLRFNIYVYSSQTDEESKFWKYIGVPKSDSTRAQFVLPNLVNCTKLKLEFAEVTSFEFNSDGSLYAGAAKFIFIQKSTTDYEVIQYHKNMGYQQLKLIPQSKISSYWTNGDKKDGPSSNLFDDNDGGKSYWESSIYTDDSNHASVFVNFTQLIKLEELILGAYKGATDNYGFPLKVNIYTSDDDNKELELKATFQGSPDGDTILHQFTLRKPISCSRLQLEFVDVLETGIIKKDKYACLTCLKFIGEIIEFSSSDLQDDFTTQYVNNSYPLHGLNDTSLIVNDLPSDNDYLFVIEKHFFFNNVSFSCPDASMSAIKGNHSNQVVVKSCKFNSCSVKSEIGSGGAILSINCVLKCETSHFVNCHSKKNGGGGGISIALDQNVEEDVVITNCNFSECSASFGGGLFLYSKADSTNVIIKKCNFQLNSIIEFSDSLNGGSAIYINALRATVRLCKFFQNSGFSSIKIDNDIENVPSVFLEHKTEINYPVSIEKCEFEIDSSSKASLSYVRGKKNAVDTIVSDCVFTGKLMNKAHHILVESKLKINERPKLNVMACKFACHKSKAINVNFNDLSNSLVAFNLNNQIFENETVSSNSKRLFIAALSLVFVAVIALIGVAITFSLKKKNDIDGIENIDSLNLPLDRADL